jgi:hypothetical protein
MRLLRVGLAIGFCVALTGVFIRVYFAPPVSWTEWVLLTAGVSLLGGAAIGRAWAVQLAFAVNVALAVLLVAIVVAFGHWGHPEFLLVQVALSTAATAAAVRLREGSAGAFSGSA